MALSLLFYIYKQVIWYLRISFLFAMADDIKLVNHCSKNNQYTERKNSYDLTAGDIKLVSHCSKNSQHTERKNSYDLTADDIKLVSHCSKNN